MTYNLLFKNNQIINNKEQNYLINEEINKHNQFTKSLDNLKSNIINIQKKDNKNNHSKINYYNEFKIKVNPKSSWDRIKNLELIKMDTNFNDKMEKMDKEVLIINNTFNTTFNNYITTFDKIQKINEINEKELNVFIDKFNIFINYFDIFNNIVTNLYTSPNNLVLDNILIKPDLIYKELINVKYTYDININISSKIKNYIINEEKKKIINDMIKYINSIIIIFKENKIDKIDKIEKLNTFISEVNKINNNTNINLTGDINNILAENIINTSFECDLKDINKINSFINTITNINNVNLDQNNVNLDQKKVIKELVELNDNIPNNTLNTNEEILIQCQTNEKNFKQYQIKIIELFNLITKRNIKYNELENNIIYYNKIIDILCQLIIKYYETNSISFDDLKIYDDYIVTNNEYNKVYEIYEKNFNNFDKISVTSNNINSIHTNIVNIINQINSLYINEKKKTDKNITNIGNLISYPKESSIKSSSTKFEFNKKKYEFNKNNDINTADIKKVIKEINDVNTKFKDYKENIVETNNKIINNIQSQIDIKKFHILFFKCQDINDKIKEKITELIKGSKKEKNNNLYELIKVLKSDISVIDQIDIVIEQNDIVIEQSGGLLNQINKLSDQTDYLFNRTNILVFNNNCINKLKEIFNKFSKSFTNYKLNINHIWEHIIYIEITKQLIDHQVYTHLDLIKINKYLNILNKMSYDMNIMEHHYITIKTVQNFLLWLKKKYDTLNENNDNNNTLNKNYIIDLYKNNNQTYFVMSVFLFNTFKDKMDKYNNSLSLKIL